LHFCGCRGDAIVVHAIAESRSGALLRFRVL
jgi:hypothetical protein